ncbi:hypothetical protein ACFOWE_07000 [Planomonospora corallina]|uniref:Secreted protein n=1 Tax=Planomonospora corallina TaxID=1806052 RepID=A0ABV8I484_9ACTN
MDRNRWLSSASAVGLLGALLTAGVVSAAPGQAVADVTSKVCTDYTNEKVWQTTNGWARARLRTCLEWVPNGNAIRARGEFQLDWPSNCTLSVGLPRSVSATCPAGLLRKSAGMSLKKLHLNIGWRDSATGAWKYGTCTTTLNARFAGIGSSPRTKYCTGPWMAHPAGVHSSSVSITADVADDGDDYKTLDEVRSSWQWSGK